MCSFTPSLTHSLIETPLIQLLVELVIRLVKYSLDALHQFTPKVKIPSSSPQLVTPHLLSTPRPHCLLPFSFPLSHLNRVKH